METFFIYTDLQNILLSMESDEDINVCKNYIEKHGLLKNLKRFESTMKLFASVILAKPKVFNNILKLISFLEDSISDKMRYIDQESYYKGNEILFFFHLLISNWKERFYFLCFHVPEEKQRTSVINTNNQYVNAIFDDNVELLQHMISQNNYDIITKISCYDYIFRDLIEYTDIIGSSALFGSIKCFKYLMMISDDIDYESLLKNSICGGNYEIIHIVENHIKDLNNKSNQNLLYLAIQFMNNDLIEYIIDNYDVKIDTNCYNECIKSSNYEAMLILLELDEEKEENLNRYTQKEYIITPINYSAQRSHFYFMKFLLSIDVVNPFKLDSHLFSLLQYATMEGRHYIVEYIIKNDLGDPNFAYSERRTPFEICLENCDHYLFDLFSEKFECMKDEFCNCEIIDDDDEKLEDHINQSEYVQKLVKDRNISKINNMKSKIERSKKKKKYRRNRMKNKKFI
ncbi:hypothetical protein M9Y10_015802 [Tritrichomonas musculus]|uniref:DUF3447 domain-containing protein n=1 Tax=Tritrichomonas musculus TaxID=1915356 RepID=A0ABR2I5L8_9EUKA